MPGCPIIRFEKHKTSASLLGAMGHHARTIPTKNADPERLHDNQVLWGTGDPAEVARRVKERAEPLARRKDAVRAVELFLGASEEFWQAGGNWRELGKAHLAMLQREFGPQNIVGMGVHLDERRPHFWAVITPVTPEGKLSAAHWFDGPQKLRQLLDRAEVDFASLGMERARRGVRATHLDMQTLHNANAGNPRAAGKVARELARRERAALDKAAAAEARRTAAAGAAAEATARAARAVQQLQALTAKVKAIEEEQAKLERARRYLQEVREAIADALELMPVHLAEKIADRFKLLQRHASSQAATAEVKGPDMAEQRAAVPPQKRAPRPG